MFYKLPTAHIHNQNYPMFLKEKKKKTTPCSLYIKLSQVPIKKNKTTPKKKSHSREGCVMR